MPNTNPNAEGETTPKELIEGETPSQETPSESSFSGFTEDYSILDHLKSSKALIEQDFELSKDCGRARKNDDSIIDGSNFAGKDHKPFDSAVKPNSKSKNDNLDLPKGSEYRKENNSSLL
ncbi:MAG: hypothetical protein KBD48_01260 [Candidatus Pacebacteria bacterium]|nr:hypothetical protein [Candidatus Paceibacterota bacterium]MBP9715804.1 hypothetical protein [Candidatus Paceibacterota bacterium]